MLSIAEAFPSAVAAVMRHDDPEAAYEACLHAARAGIQTLEVTTSVPDHLSVVRRLLESARVPVGIGTVTRPEQVDAAARIGASFVVTPVLVPEVAAAATAAGILCVLGALTPTEIFAAQQAGAGLVKVFPIASVGGARYIELVTAPLGPVPIWVSGGVEIDDVPGYLKAGVRAVGLTTAVFPVAALRSGDFTAVTELARRASVLTAA